MHESKFACWIVSAFNIPVVWLLFTLFSSSIHIKMWKKKKIYIFLLSAPMNKFTQTYDSQPLYWHFIWNHQIVWQGWQGGWQGGWQEVTVYLIFFIEKYYMFIFFAEEIKEEVNFPWLLTISPFLGFLKKQALYYFSNIIKDLSKHGYFKIYVGCFYIYI